MATFNCFSLLFSLAHKSLSIEILICWHHFNSIPKVTQSWKHLFFWAKHPSQQFTAHLFLPSQSVELNLLNGVHQMFTAMFRNNDVTWWAHLNKKNYRFKNLMRRSHPSCRHLPCEKGYNKQIKICQPNIEMKAGMLLEISSVR